MRTTAWACGRRIARTSFITALAAVGATAGTASAATYSQTVLGESPAPQVYYKLDEGVGATTAADSALADGATNATYFNSVRNRREAAVACEWRTPWNDRISQACVTRADGAGWSAYFAGAPYNPQVVAPSVDESASYTLEAWVKPTVAGLDGGIVDHGDNGVLLLDGGAPRFVAHARDGNADVTALSALSLDEWHHVAASWNNATGTARLYVDGAPAGTDLAQPTLDGATSGSPAFAIGWTNQDGAAGLFRGYIDNVAKYPAAIDVSGHYAFGIAGGSGDILSLTPENGSAFSADSNKGSATDLEFTCSIACTYEVRKQPGDVLIESGGPTLSYDGDLPLGAGPGTYTITLTAANGHVRVSNYTLGDFSSVITNDNPVAWWRFDELDGIGIAEDSAGTFDGAYQNPSSNGGIGISGDASAARLFKAGDGGYVGVNDVPAQTEGYTIELWFKASDSGDMALFDHGAHGGGPALYLEGGKVKYRAVTGDIVEAPYNWANWTHVSATWDGITARLYVDGQPAGTPAAVSLSPSGSPALYLGFANVGLEKPAFRGLMDEVSYYGEALSANRVLNHYLADPPPPSAQGPTNSADSSNPSVASPAAVAAPATAKARAKAKAKRNAKAKAMAKAKARAKARAKAKARGKSAKGKARKAKARGSRRRA